MTDEAKRVQAFATNYAGRRMRRPGTEVVGIVAGWTSGGTAVIIDRTAEDGGGGWLVDLTAEDGGGGWLVDLEIPVKYDRWTIPPVAGHRYWYMSPDGLELAEEEPAP